jgi:hypothetical protein
MPGEGRWGGAGAGAPPQPRVARLPLPAALRFAGRGDLAAGAAGVEERGDVIGRCAGFRTFPLTKSYRVIYFALPQ